MLEPFIDTVIICTMTSLVIIFTGFHKPGMGLEGTELANAYVDTIRLKLLKIGAVITRNTRRIRFLLSSAYPYQDLFALVTAKLQPT